MDILVKYVLSSGEHVLTTGGKKLFLLVRVKHLRLFPGGGELPEYICLYLGLRLGGAPHIREDGAGPHQLPD